MDLFVLLFSNLLPLYILIGLGWVAGRYFGVDRQTLGSLAIYVLMPIVAFSKIVRLEFEPAYVILPLLVYAILSAQSFFWLYIGQKVFKNSRANLLAMTASSANTGYMGLPVVMALFNETWVAVYIFMLLGGIFHEATTMYYIAARSQFTMKDSLIKLMKFPALYAVAAALIANYAGLEFSPLVQTYMDYFKGAYVVVGMMIIGAALARLDRLAINAAFLTLTFIGQFIFWPLLAGAAVAVDMMYLHLFAPEVHKLLMIMALMPPAANITAFAVQLNLNPEKAATTVLLGTIFALFYIPLMLVVLGLH